jgi:hypothetical protein
VCERERERERERETITITLVLPHDSQSGGVEREMHYGRKDRPQIVRIMATYSNTNSHINYNFKITLLLNWLSPCRAPLEHKILKTEG